MRIDLLKAAENEFFSIYPMGFDDPAMVEILKKHKPEKMYEMAQEMFEEEKFEFVGEMTENIIKIVSRASMVSMFEKPKFRDYVRSLSDDQKAILVDGLKERLHGDAEKGFNQMLAILIEGKLAKWSIMSIIPYYYAPQVEVFCKPTTVKNMIKVFELENLIYKPRPSYDFYVRFRETVKEMRSIMQHEFSRDNAAYTGMLMMMMPSS